MQSATMLKIVHAGCGAMSTTWLEALKPLANVKLVGLVDIRREAAEARRKTFAPDAAVGTDLANFLKEHRADAVFNCTIPEAHFPVTMTALKHGCHVLTEKPLGNNMVEAREMAQTAQSKARILSVIQNRRYQRPVRYLRLALREGRIGELQEISVDYYMRPRFGGFRAEMNHPLLLDMAIHHFDMARFLAGSNPTSVYCHEWNPAQSWYRAGGAAHALFTLSSGAVINYRGSWCSDGHPTSWNASWRLVGSRGTIRWDGESSVTIETVAHTDAFLPEAERQVPDIPAYPDEECGHASQIQAFVNAVSKQALPETHAGDNLRSLEMVFGSIESAESGCKIDLPLLNPGNN